MPYNGFIIERTSDRFFSYSLLFVTKEFLCAKDDALTFAARASRQRDLS
ncbi:hypothetical protein BRAO375_1310017 [Bradyrhizobium sp. ORS 375]|nr:hypothetical protein BRAO375_1310017 [Bradyrhizobium sp. ORS 375]